MKDETILARPLDEQFSPPAELLAYPLESLSKDHAVRRRVILLCALECDQWRQYHHWNREMVDEGLRVLVGDIARVEGQHELSLTSLLLPSWTLMDRALINEQAALETFAMMAQSEHDDNVRQAFEYVTIDVLEHCYLIAQEVRRQGSDPLALTLSAIPLRQGRRLENQQLTAFDAIKRPYLKETVEAATRTNVICAVAFASYLHASLQALIGRCAEPECRHMLAQIAAVTESHVSFFESLCDPTETFLMRAVVREQAEVNVYRQFAGEETEQSLRDLYRKHLADEITHQARWLAELTAREHIDVSKLTTPYADSSLALRSASDFVAGVLDKQLSRRSKGKSYVEIGKTIEAFS